MESTITNNFKKLCNMRFLKTGEFAARVGFFKQFSGWQ